MAEVRKGTVARARQRESNVVTMCAAVAEARQFLQVQVRPTEKGMRTEAAHKQDRERMAAAKEVTEGGGVAVPVYTDGSTVPGDRPTAGWGWVQ